MLNDLGKFQMERFSVENCQNLSITRLDLGYFNTHTVQVNNQAIPLTKTKCNYGGMRYWFLCPKCGRRVGNLYKRPLSSLFLCRHCQNLTYQLIKYRRSKDEEFIKLLHKMSLSTT